MRLFQSAVGPVCLGLIVFKPPFVMREHELRVPCRDVHVFYPATRLPRIAPQCSLHACRGPHLVTATNS